MRQDRPTETDQRTPGAATSGIGARGWIVAVAVESAVLLWVVRSEVTARVFVSSWTLSMPAVLILLALLGWNAARRGRGFTRAELLAAYVAISSSVTVAGYDFFQVLIATLGTGPYYASPANGWSRLLRLMPSWLLPRSGPALRGLFRGESDVPWAAWLPALAAWGSFVLAMGLASLALSALLADVWIRKERLAFPIAALPVEMTEPGGSLFRSRSAWLGFAIPAVLNSLLALHGYFPSVPALEIKHVDILSYAETPPLSLLRPLFVGFTPFILGLAYLAPVDVSFSVWFFQWVSNGERLASYALGYVDATGASSSGAPYLAEQTAGAFVALGLLILVRALPRRGRNGEPDDRPRSDALPPALVLAAGLLYALGFMVAAGFSLGLAVVLLLLYFLTVLVIARVRAEAGFAWAYGPNRFTASLSHIVVDARGTGGMAAKDLALMGLFHWFWWDLRFALLPAQIEALKIGDAGGVRRKQLLGLLAAALAVAVIVGLPWVLHDSYLYGWGTAKTYAGPASGARASFDLAASWLHNPTLPRWDRMGGMAVGAVVALALGLLRQRYSWWPFHPIGYAMASTLTGVSFWWHYLLAWAVKLCVLRYGGMRLYRRTLPLVYGLILGDVVSQCLWSLGATLTNAPVYQFVS